MATDFPIDYYIDELRYLQRVAEVARQAPALPPIADPDFVDGLRPMAFADRQRAHDLFELDFAIDDGRVSDYEVRVLR